jgi:hypothetical protein
MKPASSLKMGYTAKFSPVADICHPAGPRFEAGARTKSSAPGITALAEAEMPGP